MKPESALMRMFRAIGSDNLAWPLRRLHCPVPKDALVLEVGSGGNPYPRANVLVDPYEETSERFWVPLRRDRPFVFAFAEKLPFKARAFDFVIASHVLEHSPNPEKFIAELQRVAKAGYIEVPDALFERLNPYKDHRLEITVRGSKLVIRKKPGWIVEPETVELYEDRAKKLVTTDLIARKPFDFHVRYYWNDKIDFTVVNPEVDAGWTPESRHAHASAPRAGLKGRIRQAIIDFFQSVLSQRSRNKSIDIVPLLMCPTCSGERLAKTSDAVRCESCGASYQLAGGSPVMIPKASR